MKILNKIIVLALVVLSVGCTEDPVALPTGVGEKGFNIEPH